MKGDHNCDVIGMSPTIIRHTRIGLLCFEASSTELSPVRLEKVGIAEQPISHSCT